MKSWQLTDSGPSVSMALGRSGNCGWAYCILLFLLDATASATLAALVTDCVMYDTSAGSTTVTSQVALHPDCRSTKVRPSGHLPSMNKTLRFLHDWNAGSDDSSVYKVINKGMTLDTTCVTLTCVSVRTKRFDESTTLAGVNLAKSTIKS
jgi:hypothetical protein